MTKSYLLDDPSDFNSENERLEQQARILFRFEEQTFRDAFAGHTETLLDFGCGNGAFLGLVKNKFGRGVGVDANEALLEIAKGLHPEIQFHCSAEFSIDQLLELVDQIRPTGILLRFVAQHLTSQEWEMVHALIRYATDKRIRLVFVDVEDSEVEIAPHANDVKRCVDDLTDYIHDKGGSRHLKTKLTRWAEEAGLAPVQSSRVDLCWNATNRLDFETVFLPGYNRASAGRFSEKEVKRIFDEFFDAEGALTTPIYYVVF